MKNEKFEQAKQAVAEKHGYTDWEHIIESHARARYMRGMEKFYTEAAELYAQWMANEAVKADRSETTNEAYYDIHQDDHVVSCKAINRPLPFPQQPEQR